MFGAPLAASVLLAVPAQATLQSVLPAPEAVQHWRLVYATGTRTPVPEEPGSGRQAIGNSCWNNSSVAGPAAIPYPGQELVDWGLMACGTTSIVRSFTLSYVTTALDTSVGGGAGAAFEVAFYDQTTGFGDPGTPNDACHTARAAQRFTFNGLPGALNATTPTSHILTVDLVGGMEFCLPDGPFGWGFQGVDGETGMRLVLAGDGAGGPHPSTGTLDALDTYRAPASASNYTGTLGFGGPPNDYASGYLVLTLEDGSVQASATEFNGTGVNTLPLRAVTPPRLNATWQLEVDCTGRNGTHTSIILAALGIQPPTLLGFGELLIDLGLVAAQSPRAGGDQVHAHALPLPTDTATIGLNVYLQAVVFGGGLELSNGLSAFLGF